MKLTWLTDIHLNFLDAAARKFFYAEINDTNCDAILISGDIAEAPCLMDLLHEMADRINKPIYFILGNHDYYGNQTSAVRKTIRSATKTHNRLFWLTGSGIQKLTNNTILLGQDGWADGRLGDYENSRISLNDSRMIADLLQAKLLGKTQLLKKMQQLADIDATQLQKDLTQAIIQQPEKIIVLTHIPPFKEACLYNGKVSDNDWLPYFSSKILGDVLLSAAQANPSTEFLVLCGHTHNTANYKPFDNLTVKVGGAEYYQPKVQEVFTF